MNEEPEDIVIFKDIGSKEKPVVGWDEDTEESDKMNSDKKVPSKSDHIKETRLITILKPLLNKVMEEDLKIYNFSKGAKAKVQFTQFPDVCYNNRQIFDATGMFKNYSQLNALEHQIGASILLYLLIVRKNIPLSKKTKKFIEREEIRNFRGKLCDLVDDVKESLDLLNKKVLSQIAFDKDISDFIDSFATEEEMNVAAKIVDDLLKSGEDERSKDRVRKEEAKRWELKYSKLKQVK
uniref:Uncharacterized protein n=1 Tax=viral metagenome TaxID=1070528 RepID=A0A6H1ZYC7_9ZZZZ